MSLPRFKLAPSGPEVSALAYGLWRLAKDPLGASPARVRAKIDACLEAGITTFDHADIYGQYTCEGLFGRALAEAPALRERMEIVTKCGINAVCDNRPGVRVNHYDATPAAIERCVERSLRELRTDRVDLLLIHRPDWLTSAEETAQGLSRVVAAGKVKAVGVSNYNVHQFALLTRYLGQVPATNQVEVSLLRMEAILDGTLDQCQAGGVHPMAWSPLAGGRLLAGEEPDAVRARDALRRIGAHYGASPEQIALAWVAALPCRPQVVIGTNQVERIRDAAGSARVQLERQHWYELWTAAQGRSVP
ncbi:MAG: aldo/keto reductase [Verrucomicrobia bacterium]|nr:aldo/keto reductase [Verrucomicrobiota bacterium]